MKLENVGRMIGKDRFMALNGIDLEIKHGETVGLIGANGAGKSTLLKLLSRVTGPTDGSIEIYGRIASMLEVGTGFQGDLTGRENIYLNGTILGMTKSEIDKKMDAIIEFSEIGRHIDTPVKRYSSGMYVKLAFSVAANLDAEIMIMDEVLAVGDMAFQKKCIEKMRGIGEEHGKTILYVSHNMDTIKRLCDRCIVLDRGRVLFDGDTDKALAYMSDIESISYTEKHRYETGNVIADALLNDKAERAEQYNVKINYSGFIPTMGITDVDICTLMSNSIDNAIEACAKDSSDNMKEVTVTSDFRQGCFFFTVRNPIFEKVRIEKNNKIRNATFVLGDATLYMDKLAKTHRKVDCVILDPTRAGTTMKFIKACGKLKPSKIVYISCCPETLARDLKGFTAQGYEAQIAKPVDMFPWTDKVETIVILTEAVEKPEEEAHTP